MNESTKQISTQWILIRGLAREARHWGEFPQNLQDAYGESSRVYAIDLPGTGRYSEMTSPLTIAQMTDFAREKFLELRERQRQNGETPAKATYIVAVSLGGMVAARWLERYPNDFKGAVLINTSFRGISPFFKRLNPPALAALAGVVAAKAELARETKVLMLVSNRADLREKIAKEWATYALERPVSLENFARQLFAAATFSLPRSVPTIPVLILSSLADRMVSPDCSVSISEKWNAPIKRHATAGHDLTLDDGPWVVSEIRKFTEK